MSDLFKHNEHNFFFNKLSLVIINSLPLMLFLQIISLRIVSSCAIFMVANDFPWKINCKGYLKFIIEWHFTHTHTHTERICVCYANIPCCPSVAKSCPTLCYPMDCNMSGFLVLHHLPEFAQTHVL